MCRGLQAVSLFYPCVEDTQGRIIVKVCGLLSWSEAMKYLERNYPEKLRSAKAVPQPHDHPGLKEKP